MSEPLSPENPPKLAPKASTRTSFETQVDDPYNWIRFDIEAAKTHLTLENEYSASRLAPYQGLMDEIFEEIKQRTRETDLSVPIKIDDWEYYSRTNEGESYPQHFRRPVGSSDSEQLLLDENREAGDSEYFSVGAFEVSPDHNFLLWGYDNTGSEKVTLLVRDLRTGADSKTGITNSSGSTAWLTDSKHFYHVEVDDLHRPYKVALCKAGEEAAGSEVFCESDERFFVGVGREKDDSFIQITVSSKLAEEVYLLPANVAGEPLLVAPRREGFEYSLTHYESEFLILTNADGAENFKVMVAPDSDVAESNWKELIGESHDVAISGLDVCAGHIMLAERRGGFANISIFRFSDGERFSIPKPHQPATTLLGSNLEFDSTKVRYLEATMHRPNSVLEYDLLQHSSELLKQQPVEGDFDPDAYSTEIRWATAADGTKIPISLAYSGELNEQRPLVLYAYGAYEISIDPSFSIARLSLLDRGAVFALAHIRGGGELGRKWHADGRLENKENTFSDLIAVTEYLADNKLVDPTKVCIRGASAGGLTVGAAANIRPDLFSCVVAEVPFVDVVNTMSDETLPLTATEWEEWGNPKESKEIYDRLRSYSPYENVSSGPYPDFLITTGLNDPWVGFWEPTKWVQVLRDNTDSEILLHAELDSGHGGPSGRYDAWHDEARVLGYICSKLGLA